MPKNFPSHYLLTWGGSIVNGNQRIEEWSNTLRGKFVSTGLGGDIDGPNDVRDEGELVKWLTNTAAPRLSDFLQSPSSNISGAARLEYVKVNRIGPDGRYVEAFTAGVYDLDVQGSGGPLRYPLQVSLAVTLETDASRGNGNRGRIYLPTPAHTLASSGVVDAGALEQTISAVTTLLQGLADNEAAEFTRFVPCVVSGGGVKDPIGVARLITSVSADNRLDVQRSRGEQQVTTRFNGARLNYVPDAE